MGGDGGGDGDVFWLDMGFWVDVGGNGVVFEKFFNVVVFVDLEMRGEIMK